MTTINSLDDFLQALDANPSWREAVRARILGEELLALPAKFDRFAEQQVSFNEQEVSFNEQQVTFNEEQRAFNEEQRVWNRNATVRFNRMEGDMSIFKAGIAVSKTIEDAPGIASDMGLEYVRTLSTEDLSRMAGGGLDRDTHRSFRNADLVIEATDGTDTKYIVAEISYTAGTWDVVRVIRNAELVTRFTGKPAQATVASMRNTREVDEAIESGEVYWHRLDDRIPRPE